MTLRIHVLQKPLYEKVEAAVSVSIGCC